MAVVPYSAVPVTQKQRHRLRLAELDQEYVGRGWEADHRDIATFLLPRAGRFTPESETNESRRSSMSHLLNMRATEAVQVGVSGLLAGTSSPSRPWFNLTLRDKELAKYGPVRVWLHQVRELLLSVFARSNTYGAFSHLYEQALVFATGADLVFPDFENVVHHHPLTAGEYRLGADDKGRVNTIARRYVRTVSQLVERFGLERVSQHAKNAWERGHLNERVTVIHLIEPREHTKPGSRLAKDMPYASVYWEEADSGRDDYLEESGMRRFRALAPRWKIYSGDLYGEGPGAYALGQVKALQHKELRKAEAIDYKTKPPMTAPAAMQGMELDMLPGGMSYHTGLTADGIKPLFETRLELRDLHEDILKTEQSIDTLFFRDLFMLVTSSERAMTAYEVAKRYEEKLLVLGPTLDRLHSEQHAPMVDMAFEDLAAARALPPIPEELADQELSVEFISPLAQAQRLLGMQAAERLLGLTFQIAGGGRVDALDVLDTDAIIEDAVEMLGTNPKYLVPPEVRKQARAARAQQQAAAAQAELAGQVAGAVKDASASGLGNEMQSEAAQALQQFSG